MSQGTDDNAATLDMRSQFIHTHVEQASFDESQLGIGGEGAGQTFWCTNNSSHLHASFQQLLQDELADISSSTEDENTRHFLGSSLKRIRVCRGGEEEEGQVDCVLKDKPR